MTELSGHDAHDSYAYVQLRACQNDLHDASMRIFELERQVDALRELAGDLFEDIRDIDNMAAWYEPRMAELGIEVD